MNDRKRNTGKKSEGMPPVALASFLAIATVVLCLLIAIVVEEDDSIQTCNFENGPFEFKVVSNQEVEIVKYNGCEQTVSIPKDIEFESIMYTVKYIGKEAFRHNTSLVELTIPDNVSKLGKLAFADCENLNKLTIPISLNAVTDYDKPAFGNSNNIKEFFLTKGTGKCFDKYDYGLITMVGSKAPWNTSTQEINIVLEEGIKDISSQAFSDSQPLIKSFVLPSTIERIGDEFDVRIENLTIPVSFDISSMPEFEITELKSVTFTEGKDGKSCNYDKLGQTPWKKCKSTIETIIVSEGVKTLSKGMFKDNNIKNVSLPDSLEEIGENAFKGCKKLTDIQFGNGLTSIGKDAFKDIEFFDSDGHTRLEPTAENLRGFTFTGSHNSMIKK